MIVVKRVFYMFIVSILLYKYTFYEQSRDKESLFQRNKHVFYSKHLVYALKENFKKFYATFVKFFDMNDSYKKIKLNILLINECNKLKIFELKKLILDYFEKERIFYAKFATKIKIMKKLNIKTKKILNYNLQSDSLSILELEDKNQAFELLKSFKNSMRNIKNFNKFDIKILFKENGNSEVGGISYEKGAFDPYFSYGVVFIENNDNILDIFVKSLHEIYHLLGAESDNVFGSLMNCIHETNNVKLSIKSKKEILKFLTNI